MPARSPTRVLIEKLLPTGKWKTETFFEYKRDRRGTATGYRTAEMVFDDMKKAEPDAQWRMRIQKMKKPTLAVAGAGASLAALGGSEAEAAPTPDIREGIIETARSLGISPQDLATAISYETGGTFDPVKKGPVTKWGRHQGLIQFGEPQARQHGVNWNDPVRSQLGADGAVARYLRQAGVTPGMGLLDIYSAINTGRPGRYQARDAAAGGAPGTVLEKVQQQMAGHRKNAEKLLGLAPASAVAVSPKPDAQPVQPVQPDARLNSQPAQMFASNTPPGLEEPMALLAKWQAQQAQVQTQPQQAQQVQQASAPIGGPQELQEPNPLADPAQLGMWIRKQLGLEVSPEALASIPSIERKNDRLLRTIVASPGRLVASLPNLVGIMTALGEAPARKLGLYTGDYSPTQVAFGNAERARQQVNTFFGAEDPEDIIEHIAEALPTGIRVAAKPIEGGLKNLAEVITPLTIGGGPGRQVANVAAAGAISDTLQGQMDPGYEGVTELLGGRRDALAPSPPPSEGLLPPSLDQTSAVETNPPVIDPTGQGIMQAGMLPTGFNPEFFNQPGGKIAVGLGALTLAAAFGPQTVRLIKGAQPAPGPSLIEGGPRGSQTLETASDLNAAMWRDPNELPARVAARAGVSPQVVDELRKIADLDTHAAGSLHRSNAMSTGRMESSAGTFSVSVPPQRLLETYYRWDEPTQASFDQYLNYYHALDHTRRYGARATGATTTQLQQAIQALEQANPQFRPMKLRVEEVTREIRRFASSGNYAVVDPVAAQALDAQFRNSIPTSGEYKLQKTAQGVLASPKRYNINQPIVQPLRQMMTQLDNMLEQRMNNEVRGRYVDEVRRASPGVFMPLTPQMRKDNKKWGENAVVVSRGVAKEHYFASNGLSDVLKFDPYYPTSDPIAAGLYTTKRMFEQGNTGRAAPEFQLVNFVRLLLQSKVYTPQGFRQPTIAGSLTAIPQQLGARMAHSISEQIMASLDAGTRSRWVQLFGQQGARSLAQTLAGAYTNSWVAAIERGGFANTSWAHQQFRISEKRIFTFLDDPKTSPALRALVTGYKNLLDSIGTAPAFNFAKRNIQAGVAPDKAVQQMRLLTGDPTKGGRSLHGGLFQKSKPMGSRSVISPDGTTRQVYSFASGRNKRRFDLMATAYVTEAGRIMVPWWNPMIQDFARMIDVYTQNPALFTARVWTHVVAPAAIAYWATYGAGPEYVRHAQERRGEWNRTMTLYLPIPGKPPEEGIEWPLPHSIAFFARAVTDTLDRLMRPGQMLFTAQEDAWKLAASWLGAAVAPVIPPLGGVGFGLAGISPPSDFFGTEGAYTVPSEGETAINHVPRNLEIVARSLVGGVAQTMISAAESFFEARRTGENPLRAAGRAVVEDRTKRVPILSNLAGWKTMHSNVRMADELFKYNKKLQELEQFYTSWDERYLTPKGRIPGERPNEPISKQGGQIVGDKFDTPSQTVGVRQPPPTNPLYKLFMQRVYESYGKDSQGWKTLWQKRANASRQIRSLRQASSGNRAAWEKDPSGKADVLKIAREQGFNLTTRHGFNSLINYFEKIRQDIDEQMIIRIKRTEQEFSKELGRPVTLMDIGAYN